MALISRVNDAMIDQRQTNGRKEKIAFLTVGTKKWILIHELGWIKKFIGLEDESNSAIARSLLPMA
jgi:hypothetical protein